MLSAVGKEMLYSAEQIGAEASTARLCPGHAASRQQPCKEFLRQITSIFLVPARAAEKSKDGLPIRPAQFTERLLRLCGISLRSQYQGPACRGEATWSVSLWG